MAKTLTEKAVALADLMTLSAEIGAAPRIEANGQVVLVGPADAAPRTIGATVEDAVRHLKGHGAEPTVAKRDGARS